MEQTAALGPAGCFNLIICQLCAVKTQLADKMSGKSNLLTCFLGIKIRYFFFYSRGWKINTPSATIIIIHLIFTWHTLALSKFDPFQPILLLLSIVGDTISNLLIKFEFLSKVAFSGFPPLFSQSNYDTRNAAWPLSLMPCSFIWSLQKATFFMQFVLKSELPFKRWRNFVSWYLWIRLFILTCAFPNPYRTA